MTRSPHTLETNWREIDASALEERVIALNEWLDHTEDMIEMLKNDKEVATSSRSLAGLIRSRRDDIANAAANLRAAILEKNHKQ
jgi:hypothetical protein